MPFTRALSWLIERGAAPCALLALAAGCDAPDVAEENRTAIEQRVAERAAEIERAADEAVNEALEEQVANAADLVPPDQGGTVPLR